MMQVKTKLPIILLLLISVFIYTELQAQFIFSKTPVEAINLSKQSKQIADKGLRYRQDILYVLQEGKVAANNYVEKTTEFNAEGKIKEVLITDKTRRIRVAFIYSYTANGLLKRITKFHPTGDVLGRYEFKYDKMGFLLEKTEYDQYDYVLQKVIGEVNQTEKTFTEKYYKSPEMVTKTIVSKYTDLHNGQLTSITEYVGEEHFRLKSEYIYEKDLLHRIQFIGRHGGVIYFHEYNYNAQGLYTEIKMILPGGVSFPVNTRQYSNGLLSGEILYEGKGEISSYYKFSYK